MESTALTALDVVAHEGGTDIAYVVGISTYGFLYKCIKTSTTFSKDSTTYFTLADTDFPAIAAYNRPINQYDRMEEVFIHYMDDANSDKGSVIGGYYTDKIIDVRSNVVSAAYNLLVLPDVERRREA